MKLTANPAWLWLSPHIDKQSGAKFLRIMKLTTIIILAACLHTSAKGIAQQTITFSGKEVKLENVFNAIKKQTNYRFFFNTDMLSNASKVTIEVKNANVEQVMNMALKDQPLTFTIKGRTIFIMKKPEEEKKNTQVERTGDPITVSGRVTDDQGQPLAGANVKVKGGSNGVTTDAEGRFTLNNVDPNASLEISFVGHETQLLAVKGKTVFSVALGQKQSILDETVVIAYGTTSRRFSTGNVTTIKAADIERQPVNNPLLALQGAVPGLLITQASGVAGGGVVVRVQGENSIGRGSDPLYVIDGIPYTSQLLPNLAGTLLRGSGGPVINGVQGGGGNPLTYINPADIESIDVLKDADATAIYGSRAANGAILITTKKGKAGQTKVGLNIQTGWTKVKRKLDLLNNEQYIAMRREAFRNDNATVNLTTTDFDLNGLWDSTRFTDWQDVLIGGTGNFTDLQASVTGGSTNTQIFVGAGYHLEKTVFPGDFNDQKGSIHFNINNVSSNQRFRIQFSGNYLVDNNKLPQVDLTASALQLAPTAPALYNEDGTLNWMVNANGTSSWTNPLKYTIQKYRSKTTNLISNVNLSYKLLPDLEVKSSIGYNDLGVNDFSLSPLTAEKPEERVNTQNSAAFMSSKINSWIIEPQISYRKKIWKGSLEALVGTTINQINSNYQQIVGFGFISDEVLEDIKSASSVSVGNTGKAVYKYNAAFGRINYNWENKYILNLTARRDGSSRFGRESQFHNFWSSGFAWIFTKERWIKNIFSFLSFGKLRGSYGTTGNDQIGDYQFLNLYTPVTVDVPYQNVAGLEVKGLPNPHFAWEETKKLQFGIDIGLFNDRIIATANFARNRSSNQLLPYSLPWVTGAGALSAINFPATIQNVSWELSLSIDNIKTKEFTWSSNINLTIPKNKLVEFPNLEQSTYNGRLFIDEPISINKAYRYIGVDPASGVFMFEDKNGNSVSSPNFTTDQTVLINTMPKYFGGFKNNIAYKGFQLDFLFQFVKQIGKNYLFNGTPGRFVAGLGNQPVDVLNRWQKPGDLTDFQKFSQNTTLNSSASNFRSSDESFSDASFIRLKNLSLSYTLPQGWNKFRIQNFRVFLQAQNLLTVTSYKGLDPETKSATILPPLAVLTLGFHLDF
jgi:TonB-linked SusC/RagA family outer membrane protein